MAKKAEKILQPGETYTVKIPAKGMEVPYLLSLLNKGTNKNRTTLDALLLPATRQLNKMPGDQLLLDIPKKLKNKYLEWINIQLASGRLDSTIFDLIQKEVDGISSHALEKLDVPEEPKRFVIPSNPLLEEEEDLREGTSASVAVLREEPALTHVPHVREDLSSESRLETLETEPMNKLVTSIEENVKVPVEPVVIQNDPDDKNGLASVFG
jgi:hypothetical protein